MNNYIKTMRIILFLITFILISSHTFSQELKPNEQTALLKVLVTDFSNVPRAGETVMIIGKKTKKRYTCVTDATGKAQLLLPEGQGYDVKYKEISEFVDYTEFDVPAAPGIQSFDLLLQFDPPKTYVLKNVLFDTGKATLKTESFPALNDLVTVLKAKEAMEIEIAGHTDNVGTPESNLKLSQARSESVKKYLVSKGISANRVIAKGYGETMPVADNGTPEGRKENRRTEVKILKE